MNTNRATKEEIESLGWLMTKDYSHSGEGWRFQIQMEEDKNIEEGFWELEYYPDSGHIVIETWKSTGDMEASIIQKNVDNGNIEDVKRTMVLTGIQ